MKYFLEIKTERKIMAPLSYFINKKLKITYIHDVQARNFVKLETPCKECYLQTMCLETIKPEYDIGSGTLARSCEKLENFVTNNYTELPTDNIITELITLYLEYIS
jgi:hypothetical protein